MSKEIALSQGKVALVDDEDYDWLNQWKWCADKQGRSWYARWSVRDSETGRMLSVGMHRHILDAPRGLRVVHLDFDGLNNQRSNLRLSTRAESNSHQRKQLRLTSSRFQGVSWHKRDGCWYAQIDFGGSRHYLGVFDDEVDAARAYNAAAVLHHGEFASLNALPGSPGSG